MDVGEIGLGKLRLTGRGWLQARPQRRVVERGRLGVRQSRGGRRGQIVGDRALGDPHGGGDLGIRQRALVLEAQNFANSSHGNRLGWHRRLPEQKGARVPSRKFELPRNATSPSRSRSSFPTIVTDNPTNLTAISDATEKAVTFRRNHRSTSSDFAVNIVRKPRSPCVGIHTYVALRTMNLPRYRCQRPCSSSAARGALYYELAPLSRLAERCAAAHASGLVLREAAGKLGDVACVAVRAIFINPFHEQEF